MAYNAEWDYLIQNTDLWHIYNPKNIDDSMHFQEKIPDDQVLIECQGYLKCQRTYRSITCRSFPFFPYIDHQGKFIGLTYYWEYEDRCWVINHLDTVSPQYRDEFIQAFDYLFQISEQEYLNFRHQSIIMRRVFGRKKRTIPLISRKSTDQLLFYKISPRTGRKQKVEGNSFSKHGVYYFAEKLPFDEDEF